MKNVIRCCLLALISSVVVTDFALAEETFILATGRRDPRIYAIDFNAALKSRSPSPNAIVSRSKVLPDRLDGTPLGDPANIVLSEDNRTAYVINHHGVARTTLIKLQSKPADERWWVPADIDAPPSTEPVSHERIGFTREDVSRVLADL